MNAMELMREIQSRRIFVHLDDGRLRIEAPVGALTDDIKLALTAHKAGLVAALSQTCAEGEPPIRTTARASESPVSFAQQRLWFLEQFGSGAASYVIPAAFRFIGSLNIAALSWAVNAIVARHETLRTRFSVVDGEAIQIVAPSLEIDCPVVDLCDLEADARAAEALRLIERETRRPFDLTQGPLLRVLIIDLGVGEEAREHLVAFTLHHIVSDGWSTDVLMRELAALYEARIAGRPSPLAPLPIQYADYAAWQRDWLRGERLERQLSYWRRRLTDASMVLELPTDHPRPAVQDSAGGVHRFAIPAALADRLKSLAREQGATLFMVLLAAFQLLLSRYSGQSDICVGAPTANRRRVELEGLIGFFVNTLALRADLSGDPSFVTLLERVREAALGAQEHQDLPFERLVEELRPARDMSRSPLFQAMFVFQNAPARAFSLAGLRIESLAADSGTSKFDLTLEVAEGEGALSASIEYAAALFEPSTIARMADHYRNLLEAIVADPRARIGTLPMLSGPERRRLLIDWNDTSAEFPHDLCIHELFEAQAQRAPDAVAAIFRDESLTYGELNARASRLARHLVGLGVGPETIVGLCVERSLEMVVALLGVLKAAGAYLPLDADYPAERLAYMIADASPRLVLTQERLAERLPTGTQILRLDADREQFESEGVEALDRRAAPQNLAYVIYTSGSTGRPKGVMIEHRSCANLLWSMRELLGLDSADRMLALTTISFDIAALELFLPLLCGARSIIAERADSFDPARIADLISKCRTTALQATPATWRMLVDFGWRGEKSMKKALCGGEALSTDLAVRIGERVAAVWNVYGPTEAAIWSTASRVRREKAEEQPFQPIGRPIANTRIYIVDGYGEPTPIGVAGELCIAGAGLARGYLGRPDITAERFVEDPFSTDPGGRLYRTGDLARWRADGSIEFLGRLDHQVKIRGFRIELGEIESCLGRHEAIREAVVVAREDRSGDKQLVAYVVHNGERKAEPSDIRAHLRAFLPDHMIPAAFVYLAELPLTANGKLDRKALPAPDLDARPRSEHVAPRTQTEWILLREFKEILGLERIGVDDNFFELGGSSILGMKLIERIRRSLCSTLLVTAIFRAPTVAQLARLISSDEDRMQTSLVRMSAGPARAPLYCIHPAGGSIIRYQPLAKRVGAVRPVFGLQSRHLLEPDYRALSIEQMAADYVALIQRNQQRGPYLLLGWSAGAAIALAIASLLEARGEQVAFLGLLDPALSASPSLSRSSILDHIQQFADFQGVDVETSLTAEDRRHLLETQSGMTDRERFVYAGVWGQERGFWSDVSSEVLNMLFDDSVTFQDMLGRLHVDTVSADLSVWWASKSLGASHASPIDLGERTSGAVLTHWANATHEEIVVDDDVHSEIVEVLREID